MRSSCALLAIPLVSLIPALVDWLLLIPMPKNLPTVASNENWGDRVPEGYQPQQFTVNVSDAVLDDMHIRLKARKQFAPMPYSQKGSAGIEPSELEPLLDHLITQYDWRKHEAAMNDLGLFEMVVDGLSLIFHRLRPSDNAPRSHRAVLLLHGWPGSIVELQPLLRALALQQQNETGVLRGVDLVAPCLPGYGFSSAPIREGYDTVAMGRTLHRLMARLGYDDFVVHGGDWGSLVAQAMAFTHPKPISALHLHFFPVAPSLGSLVTDQLLTRAFGSEEDIAHARDGLDVTTTGRTASNLNEPYLR